VSRGEEAGAAAEPWEEACEGGWVGGVGGLMF